MNVTHLRSIQSGLRGPGHDPGPIDGRWGTRTREALEAFLAAADAAPAAPATPPAAPATPPAAPGGAMIHQGAARYPVRKVIVHCAATRPEWMAHRPLAEKRAEIRRWHTDPVSKGGRGWKDIGYHWLIDRDGQVIAGRTETTIGAHVADHNWGTLGICLIGGHGASTNVGSATISRPRRTQPCAA